MDFFEKAHVLKRHSSKKDSQSEENMKKQLKQMLDGYKKSDNELIKTSGNMNNEDYKGFDDSTSVSGFSDLNLTISENEADTSRAIVSIQFEDADSYNSQENSYNTSELSRLEDIAENSHESSSDIDCYVEGDLEDTQESISEYNEGIESLSDDIELLEDSLLSSEDLSLTDTFGAASGIEANDSDSVEFDPDGSLATKIFERLEQQDLLDKKVKKQKVEDVAKKDRPKKDKVKTRKQDKDCNIPIESLNISKNNYENAESVSVNDDTADSVSTNQSSPYISITVSEMPNESLSEILGDYRHPTIRNLPSEKQNIVHAENSHNMFGTEIDMQVEDVDSLIPELGDEEIVDLDLEESTIPVEDSMAVYDTITSDTEMELSTDDNFVNPLKVFFGKGCCVFVLKHPTQLFVNGKVKIKPLGGTVEVFGYTLKDTVDLYAPNHSYAHCLKTVENINAYYGLFGKLTSAGLTVAEAEEIVTTIGEYDGIIQMSPLDDKKMDFVENNFTATDLFTKANKNIDTYLRKACMKLKCSLYLTRPFRFFEENERWNEVFKNGLNETSRGIVCGGKGLGKSTFLRYYVNRMLEDGPVLVIDLDPGQAEFTVAGCVSATVVTRPLLGPNFTHLKKPDIMLNIGMVNTMDNIVHYANAVSELISACRSNPAYFALPWIVNTMGMCNNLGLKLVTLAILHTQPTFLLQLDTKTAKKRFDCILQPYNISRLYHEEFRKDRLFRNIKFPELLEYNFVMTQHVGGSERHNTALSPKDERYLNFLAYFGELLCQHREESLLGILPYEVKLSDLNIVTNVKVASEAVTRVINGKIVALCQLTAPDNRKVFTMDDKPLLCHGHGLVRGVDYESGTLYVVTPLAAAELRAVDVLVYADWAPELQGGALPAGTRVPYRSPAARTHRQLMLSPCRRFNPLQLLKMSRST